LAKYGPFFGASLSVVVVFLAEDYFLLLLGVMPAASC
jgi:hypothetical protein